MPCSIIAGFGEANAFRAGTRSSSHLFSIEGEAATKGSQASITTAEPSVNITIVGTEPVEPLASGGAPYLNAEQAKVGQSLTHHEVNSVGGPSSTIIEDINKFQDKIDSIRIRLPNNRLKKGGNMAVAEVYIDGLPNEFISHSRIHNEMVSGLDEISFSPLRNAEERAFTRYEPTAGHPGGNKFDRHADTEAKILEDINGKIGSNNKISGAIELYTELLACQSCTNIILEFRERYPNIKLDIFAKDMEHGENKWK